MPFIARPNAPPLPFPSHGPRRRRLQALWLLCVAGAASLGAPQAQAYIPPGIGIRTPTWDETLVQWLTEHGALVGAVAAAIAMVFVFECCFRPTFPDRGARRVDGTAR
ncbi:MAG: hypothetical protein EXS13_02895 [Planctomycetes bacterium]|nr:hypothetical protein [Planctomycetota bacterium]